MPEIKTFGASSVGFHFYNLYQNCPRKFFLKMVCKLESPFIAPALIGGTAFHEGKAVWYTTKSIKRALNTCESHIKNFKSAYEKEEDYDKDLSRYPLMLESWIAEYGKDDLKNYTILGVEREFSARIPSPSGKAFKATGRIDLLVEDQSGIYVVDTKTSSFSIKQTIDTLYYGDQATMYLWLVEVNLGKPVNGLIPDIAYWNKNAVRESNMTFTRGNGTVIMRSKRAKEEFAMNLGAIHNEIAQKIEAYKSKKFFDAELFPRNTHYCMAFFRPCEFADVCRECITPRTKAPLGLVKTNKRNKIESPVADSMASE